MQITLPNAKALAMLAIMIGLAACENTGAFNSTKDDPFAPAGVGQGDYVDGLTVGHRLMEAKEYELALKAYHRAVVERGVNVDVLSAIGSANLMLGRLGQAERVLRRAIELDETFPPAWNNLGAVLMEKGAYGEASRVFRIAFALDSGRSAEIRENLRLALAKVGDPDYSAPTEDFRLVRRGPGFYQILGSSENPEE